MGVGGDWQQDIGALLQVKVTPKAAANYIKAEKDESGQWLLRVYVTAAPEDGKANKAVIALLAKEMGLRKSAFVIEQGAKNAHKIIRVTP